MGLHAPATRIRMELRQTAGRTLEHFSMVQGELQSFL